MNNLLPRLACALLAATLAGCALIPDAQRPESAALPARTAVALGQSVTVGSMVATPMAVVEDSRCPVNARCVWPGRLVVTTRIDGPGWRDTADLTLGEPWSTHGVMIVLVLGEPGRETGAKIAPADYRFTYEVR